MFWQRFWRNIGPMLGVMTFAAFVFIIGFIIMGTVFLLDKVFPFGLAVSIAAIVILLIVAAILAALEGES